MTRRIRTHETTDADQSILIAALGAPGHGGAHQDYALTINDDSRWLLHFQEGPVKEAGVNGLTQEALLAIVIDRLRCFQAGPFACRENAIALTHIETGLLWLKMRTLERTARGVEGSTQL